MNRRCKTAIFFRSEDSLTKSNVHNELSMINNLQHIEDIITVDIWANANLNTPEFLNQIMNEVSAGKRSYEEYQNCDKICEVIDKDNSALRFSADLNNDIIALADKISEELEKRKITNIPDDDYDYDFSVNEEDKIEFTKIEKPVRKTAESELAYIQNNSNFINANKFKGFISSILSVFKNPKFLTIGIPIAITFLLIFGGIKIIPNLLVKTVDLNKYLTVEYESYNTVGKASVSFNIDKLVEDYSHKIKEKKASEYLSNSELREMFSYIYSGNLDKDSKLSNGDIITFSWDISSVDAIDIKEEYNCKIKFEDAQFTVEGLEELQTFDPFEDIEVTFSGISPDGSININNIKYQELDISCNKNEQLSNGDSVTITINDPYNDITDYFIENYGMIPSTLSKTIQWKACLIM